MARPAEPGDGRHAASGRSARATPPTLEHDAAAGPVGRRISDSAVSIAARTSLTPEELVISPTATLARRPSTSALRTATGPRTSCASCGRPVGIYKLGGYGWMCSTCVHAEQHAHGAR